MSDATEFPSDSPFITTSNRDNQSTNNRELGNDATNTQCTLVSVVVPPVTRNTAVLAPIVDSSSSTSCSSSSITTPVSASTTATPPTAVTATITPSAMPAPVTTDKNDQRPVRRSSSRIAGSYLARSGSLSLDSAFSVFDAWALAQELDEQESMRYERARGPRSRKSPGKSANRSHSGGRVRSRAQMLAQSQPQTPDITRIHGDDNKLAASLSNPVDGERTNQVDGETAAIADDEDARDMGGVQRKRMRHEERPRWQTQTYMLVQALRRHPQGECARNELIKSAIEIDAEVARERNLPRVFRGKTPVNSASACLTMNKDKMFIAFKPLGARSTHFRLAFEPGNFDNARQCYLRWLDTLVQHDWPICFGTIKETSRWKLEHVNVWKAKHEYTFEELEQKRQEERERLEEEKRQEELTEKQQEEKKRLEEACKSEELTEKQQEEQRILDEEEEAIQMAARGLQELSWRSSSLSSSICKQEADMQSTNEDNATNSSSIESSSADADASTPTHKIATSDNEIKRKYTSLMSDESSLTTTITTTSTNENEDLVKEEQLDDDINQDGTSSSTRTSNINPTAAKPTPRPIKLSPREQRAWAERAWAFRNIDTTYHPALYVKPAACDPSYRQWSIPKWKLAAYDATYNRFGSNTPKSKSSTSLASNDSQLPDQSLVDDSTNQLVTHDEMEVDPLTTSTTDQPVNSNSNISIAPSTDTATNDASTGSVADIKITLDDIELSDHPSQLSDVVYVAESTIPNAGRGLFAARHLPPWTPIGFYFGVPMTEDEFDMMKDGVGLSSHYSIMYRRTVLDATDDQGQPWTDADALANGGMYCPFHFMNEDVMRGNVAFLEGSEVNQVICMTTKPILKDEELFAYYGGEVDRHWATTSSNSNAATTTTTKEEEDNAIVSDNDDNSNSNSNSNPVVNSDNLTSSTSLSLFGENTETVSNIGASTSNHDTSNSSTNNEVNREK
ncbi:hypothetical protein BDF22DRAFT_747043 [Syncephalis plumigaleata]|nr:hypothetical protein BDF22DRAFT_747043 [Syncephalis plumigaleata]